MTERPDRRVTEIRVYPVKGEPGRDLTSVEVEADGLAGDRRKNSAVHLVTTQEALSRPRANFVIEGASDEMASLIGQRVRIGSAELTVTGPAANCPGLYADVVTPGTVRLGDGVSVVAPAAD